MPLVGKKTKKSYRKHFKSKYSESRVPPCFFCFFSLNKMVSHVINEYIYIVIQMKFCMCNNEMNKIVGNNKTLWDRIKSPLMPLRMILSGTCAGVSGHSRKTCQTFLEDSFVFEYPSIFNFAFHSACRQIRCF